MCLYIVGSLVESRELRRQSTRVLQVRSRRTHPFPAVGIQTRAYGSYYVHHIYIYSIYVEYSMLAEGTKVRKKASPPETATQRHEDRWKEAA